MDILRPYQRSGICSLVAAAKQGRHRNVCCVPTGGGKSLMISELCRLAQRAVVIVPSLPLMSQMHGVLERNLEERVDLEQGMFRANHLPYYRSRVILGSRDSMLSNDRYQGEAFRDVTCVVVDECHVGITPQMERMLAHFEERGAFIFGFSATPYKGKGKALRYWDRPCYVYSLREAVEDGYLVRPVCHIHEMVALDHSFIEHINDEWDESLLESVLSAEHLCQEVAQMIVQTYRREPSVVYCASVRQAKLLVDVLSRYGGRPALVYGTQPEEERDANMKAFTDGETPILVNVAVLSYGWDHPALRRVYFACPQRSISRYEQRIGRAMRTLTGVLQPGMTADERHAAIANSGKPVAHVHDITDSSKSIQILSALDVLDAKTRKCAKRRATLREKDEGDGIDVLSAVREMDAIEQAELQRKLDETREKRSRLLVGVTFDSSDRSPFDEPGKSRRGWRMLWGPFKGELIRELPADYLTSVSKRAKKETDLIVAIRRELDRRKQQPK